MQLIRKTPRTRKPPVQTVSNEVPLAAANPAVRQECAEVFAAQYARGQMNAEQRRNAELILELFLQDAVVEVRAAIARYLVDCPYLPKAMANRIANDVNTIAVPMIRRSAVFDEDDLIAFVNSGNIARQVAVATREIVTPPVAHLLIDSGNLRVVSALLANDGAQLEDKDLERVLDCFGEHSVIGNLLLGRENLPLVVLERMLDAATTEFNGVLERALKLPGPVAGHVCTLVHEQLLVDRIRQTQNARDVETIVARLNGQQRLSPTLVLRALCTGDVQFFSICLAERCSADQRKVRQAIRNGRHDALRRYCRDAGWSDVMFRAFVAVLQLYRAEQHNTLALAPELFAAKAVGRLAGEFDDLSAGPLDAIIAEVCWRLA